MKNLTRTAMVSVAALLSLGCQEEHTDEDEKKASVSEPPPQVKDPATPTADRTPQEVGVNTPTAAREGDKAAALAIENVGRFRAAPQLKDSVVHAMRVADANGDGQITRQEANGAMNFVIGGFFFRADEDGDGKITPSERKKARSDFSKEHPDVARMLTAFAQSKAVNTLMERLDTNVPDTIELSQVRKTIGSAVDDIFAAIDKDGDGTITAKEADRGFNVAAAKLGKAAFAKADADSDGKMTFAEFEKSVQTPLKRVFEATDVNDDGKLTSEEAASMMSWMSQRLDLMSERGYDFVSAHTDVSVNR